MSVFGFIENFFFISLAIVFALVVFLVYHFKNRISVAEKKSESMYGLLTAVVKEIKTLRGMFGLGGTESSDISVPFKGQTKTTPEVYVTVSSDESDPPSDKMRGNSTFSEYVANQNAREVITFEISPSDNKIVVSDEDSSDDEGDEGDDDDSIPSGDSESDSDSESEDVFDLHQLDLDIMELTVKEVDVVEQQEEVDVATISETEYESLQVFEQPNREEIKDDVEELDEFSEKVSSLQSDNVVDLSSITPQIPALEQLRKMNINQLKNIASQLGITTDVSKMKKPELISLIREG